MDTPITANAAKVQRVGVAEVDCPCYGATSFILDGAAAATPYIITYGGCFSDGTPSSRLLAYSFIDGLQKFEIKLSEDSSELVPMMFPVSIVVLARRGSSSAESVAFVFGTSSMHIPPSLYQLRFKYGISMLQSITLHGYLIFSYF
jgi:hypothetical protein